MPSQQEEQQINTRGQEEQAETAPSSMTQAPTNDPPSQAPQARGVAPWERVGATHLPPTDPSAQAKAEKWSRKNQPNSQSREQRRKQKAIERQRRKEEEERLRTEQLENSARRMYIVGFFALPLVWLVALIYFRKEHKDDNGNELIKQYYRGARFWFVIYTVVFVTWFIVFQVKSNTFSTINIVNFNGTSPSGI